MFRLTHSNGTPAETFETKEAAEAAVAEHYGWAECITSDYFTVTINRDLDTAQAVACYETQAECDEDADDGAYAPRIIEIEVVS